MINEFSKEYKPKIDFYLEELLQEFQFNDPRNELVKAIYNSVMAKSKSIRPLLVFATFLLFKPKNEINKILPLAAAIELIHTYSLIHDDLPSMDNDDFRRGQLACHKQFGEDIAILAGDTLNTYAFELLAKKLPEFFPAEKVIVIIEKLAYALGIFGMAGGQILDLKSTTTSIKNQEHYLKTTHQLKTGALINASIELTAYLASATDEQLHHLKKFGQSLGLLFQIIDDILDVTGQKETLGKTAQKDIKNNKLTYITLYGLEKAKNLAKVEAEKTYKELNALSNLNTTYLKTFIDYFTKRTW